MAPERMGWADGSYLEVTGDDDTSTVRAVREGAPPAGPGCVRRDRGGVAGVPDPAAVPARAPARRSAAHALPDRRDDRAAGARRWWTATGHGPAAGWPGRWTRTGTSWWLPDTCRWTARTPRPCRSSSRHSGWTTTRSPTCRDDWTKRWAPVADRARITFAGSPRRGLADIHGARRRVAWPLERPDRGGRVMADDAGDGGRRRSPIPRACARCSGSASAPSPTRPSTGSRAWSSGCWTCRSRWSRWSTTSGSSSRGRSGWPSHGRQAGDAADPLVLPARGDRGPSKVYPDARIDPQVRDNLAIPDLGVVAYAGMPLTDADGRTLGSLCAIDTKPRRWTRGRAGRPARPRRGLLVRAAPADRPRCRRGGAAARRERARAARHAGRADRDAGRDDGHRRLAAPARPSAVTPRLADWCLVTLVERRPACPAGRRGAPRPGPARRRRPVRRADDRRAAAPTSIAAGRAAHRPADRLDEGETAGDVREPRPDPESRRARRPAGLRRAT